MRRKPLPLAVGDIFDDLDKLRAAALVLTRLPRRLREAETFARVPHNRGLALYRIVGGPAWAVLIELDRLVLAQHRNPVIFWSPRLRRAGLAAGHRSRALRQLEAAGVVKVEARGAGLGPLVTHLWYPLQD